MDIKNIQSKLNSFVKKNKYVFLVLLAGIVLMALPSGKKEQTNALEDTAAEEVVELTTAQQLEAILAQVDGAGAVRVFLTEAAGRKTIYQSDSDTSVASDSTRTQNKTITVTDASKDETGLIQQINPPVYLGAIVVCQGADNPQVQLAIVDAVSKVTGLGADRISVMKMK